MEKYSIPQTSHWLNKTTEQIATLSAVAVPPTSSLISPNLEPPCVNIHTDSSQERDLDMPSKTRIPCSGESGKWKMIRMYQERNKRRQQRLDREKGKSSGKKQKSKGKKKKASSSSSSSEDSSRKKKGSPKKKKHSPKKKKKNSPKKKKKKSSPKKKSGKKKSKK